MGRLLTFQMLRIAPTAMSGGTDWRASFADFTVVRMARSQSNDGRASTSMLLGCYPRSTDADAPSNMLAMMASDAGLVDSERSSPTCASTQRRQSDEAYDAISRAIVRCDLAPGVIVSEAELAARLKLKTAATRAAVDRLSVVGLLRPIHRRGYVVKPITLRDVNDLFQLRTIIEVGVVRLAAGKVDAASLQRLELVRTKEYQPGDRDSEARFLAGQHRVPPGRGPGDRQRPADPRAGPDAERNGAAVPLRPGDAQSDRRDARGAPGADRGAGARRCRRGRAGHARRAGVVEGDGDRRLHVERIAARRQHFRRAGPRSRKLRPRDAFLALADPPRTPAEVPCAASSNSATA